MNPLPPTLLNPSWDGAFPSQDSVEACIKKLRSTHDPVQREIIAYRTYGGGTVPKAIADLLDTLNLDATQEKEVDRLPSRLFCKTLKISAYDTPIPKILSSIVTRSMPFLKVLDIHSEEITDALLDDLVAVGPHLEKLLLVECSKVSFSGVGIWNSLTELQIMGCDGLSGDAGLKKIAVCCPRLVKFFVWPAPKGPSLDYVSPQGPITASGLLALADGCRDITCVVLPDCDGISRASLEACIKKCPSLTKIGLEGRGLPSLHDAAAMLLAHELSGLEISRRDADHMHDTMRNSCSQLNVHDIVELVWACAILGFDDHDLIKTVRDRVRGYVGDSRPTEQEHLKLGWACRRLGEQWYSSYEFTQDGKEFLKALDEENSAEKRSETKRRAAEILKHFVNIV